MGDILVVCKEVVNECDWVVKAKLQSVTNFFVISKVELVHSCCGKLVGYVNKRMNPKIISNLVIEDVRSDSSTSGKDIMNTLKNSYGIDIPYWKAWRTSESAVNRNFGSYKDSYDQLMWYCDAVKRTNPGSVVYLEANKNTKHFERVFISFKACLDGFKKCRPMLFIDGTFMIGRAKGTLLAPDAKDGDNGLFPIAIVVVLAENTRNWVWFLEKLREIIHHDKEMCYISDSNTGLMSAFPMWMTNTQGKIWESISKIVFMLLIFAFSMRSSRYIKREGGKAAVDPIRQIASGTLQAHQKIWRDDVKRN